MTMNKDWLPSHARSTDLHRSVSRLMHTMFTPKLTAAVVCIYLCLMPVSTSASDQIPGQPQSKPIAIVGATIHTVIDADIESGTVLFEKGQIASLGKSVTLPEGCIVIEAHGKHVYPSLIESYSNLGLVEVNAVRASRDYREVGEFNPNVRAAAAFNPDSEIIPVNRSNGILLAVTAPSGGIVSGRSSLVMLDGWTIEDMTLKANVGMHFNWPNNQEEVAELDQFMQQAQRYLERSQDSRQDQPQDLRFDAMHGVFERDIPLIVGADRLDEIEAAVGFANKYDLRLNILGGYDAPLCAELLCSENVSVIVSAVYRNPLRRHEAYDTSYTLPKRLHDAGIRFSISAGGRFGATGVRNLPYNAATAAAYGLDARAALRSITLSPAEILGVADRVGGIKVGYDATLFVADGDILETPTQVEHAFIQGRRVDLDNRQRQLYRKYNAKYERQ